MQLINMNFPSSKRTHSAILTLIVCLIVCIPPLNGSAKSNLLQKQRSKQLQMSKFKPTGENSNSNGNLVQRQIKRIRRQSVDINKESKNYVDLIFHAYGKNSSISVDRYTMFLSNIGLYNMTISDTNGTIHPHPHPHPHASSQPSEDHNHDHLEHSDEVGEHHSDDAEHPHPHPPQALTQLSEDHSEHGEDHIGHYHHVKENMKACIQSSKLLHNYGLDGQTELSAQDFINLCPALLYQIDSGVCGHTHALDEHHDHNISAVSTQGRSGLVWLYTMMSVLIISLCALFGILCIPRKHTTNDNTTIQLLIALAMSSMSGDALLHLIPHSISPLEDGHDSHGDSDGHGDSENGEDTHDHLAALYKGLMVLVGIYSFLILERVFAIIRSKSERKKSKGTSAEISMLDIKEISHSQSQGKSHGHSHDGMFSCTSLAFIIILGDMFHNFCDGVAIGAGFSGGVSVGISTSIAVFCHELPHEIGDFAVLVSSGMSKKKAIFYNLGSTIPSFFGAAVGLELGSLGDSSSWIFAFVGGLFLYISLVNLVPEMSKVYDNPEGRWSSYLLMHGIGMTLGLVIMVVLGIYEVDLQNMLS